MSPKKKEDKKAAEIILTRNKTKRKLRNTTKSMKRIAQMTKLLRSPIRDEEEDPPVTIKKNKGKEKQSKKEGKEQSTLKKESKEQNTSKKESKELSSKQNKNKNSKETVKRNETSKLERKDVDVEEKTKNSKLEDYQLDKPPDLFLCKESMLLVKKADDEEFLPEIVKRRRRRKLVVPTPNADLKPGVGLKPVVEMKATGPKRKVDSPQKEAVKPKRSKEYEPRPEADPPKHQPSGDDGDQPEISRTEHEERQKVTSGAEQNRASQPVAPSSALDVNLETDSLTEEDFLEILTCESPVWWEDAPDEGYSEEPLSVEEILQNIKVKTIKSEPEFIENVEIKKTTTNIKFPQVTKKLNFDHRFMSKRLKLESLLGNIKNKIRDAPDNAQKIDENETKNKHNYDNNKLNYDNEKVIKNPIKDANKSNNIKKTVKDNNATDGANKNYEIKKTVNESERKSRRKSVVRKKTNISVSEGSEGENMILSLPYEDALEFLDIPIESKPETVTIDDDSYDSDIAIIDSADITDNNKELTDSNVVDKQNNLDTKLNKKASAKKTPEKLKIISIQESSSPISIKSSTDTDYNSLANVEGTISDTNIKFIDENSSGKSPIAEDISAENIRDKKCITTEATKINPKINKELSDSKKASDKMSTMLRLKQAYKELCSKNINAALNFTDKLTNKTSGVDEMLKITNSISNSVDQSAKNKTNVKGTPKNDPKNVFKVKPNCTVTYNTDITDVSEAYPKRRDIIAKTFKPETEVNTQADFGTNNDQKQLCTESDQALPARDDKVLFKSEQDTKVDSVSKNEAIKNSKDNSYVSTYLDFVCKIRCPKDAFLDPLETAENTKINSLYTKRKTYTRKVIKKSKPKSIANGPIKITEIVDFKLIASDDTEKKSNNREGLNKNKQANSSASNSELKQKDKTTQTTSNKIDTKSVKILSNKLVKKKQRSSIKSNTKNLLRHKNERDKKISNNETDIEKSKIIQTSNKIDSLESPKVIDTKLNSLKPNTETSNTEADSKEKTETSSNKIDPTINIPTTTNKVDTVKSVKIISNKLTKIKSNIKDLSTNKETGKEKAKIIQTSNKIDSLETTKVINTKLSNLEPNTENARQKCCTCENVNSNIPCLTCGIDADKKSLDFSNSTVKYCMICSAIFDTENCGYCLQKDNGEKSKTL